VIHARKALHVAAALLILGLSLASPAADAQQTEAPSCAEKLTEQLRRFSEKCLSDLVSYVASQPKMGARVASEAEKFYVVILREGDRLRADAVSKFNYALMKEETAAALKQLGWHPPENESDNWRKYFDSDGVRTGAAAEDIAKALAAYGLKKDQPITLTVGPDISS
jgi:hypothetical protein